ncbi:hypothetical protein CPB85DRAFT_393015 [Mucidula mucida]|nr:hypothetical protein CPB85DRAFT_393015 [Mucidula mucida]
MASYSLPSVYTLVSTHILLYSTIVYTSLFCMTRTTPQRGQQAVFGRLLTSFMRARASRCCCITSYFYLWASFGYILHLKHCWHCITTPYRNLSTRIVSIFGIYLDPPSTTAVCGLLNVAFVQVINMCAWLVRYCEIKRESWYMRVLIKCPGCR